MRALFQSGGLVSGIVDTHTHVISPDRERYPLAPVGGRQSDWSAHHATDADALLRAMDDAGIERAMVVQASTAYGNDNRYVADTVCAHSDRFAGVFSVDMLAVDNVDQMRRWLDAGLSGLRIFTTGTTMPGQADWLDDERTFPVWEYAQQHDVSICLQMAAAGIPKLRGLLTRFPRVRVLLDHLARPDLSDGPPYLLAAALFELATNDRVHLKLTNRTVREAARGASTADVFFPRLIAAFGAHRIAWGSNFPAADGTLASLLAEAQGSLAMLSDSDRRWIFGGTARAIYPMLTGASPDGGRA
ncbi:MAG: amidohydrolase [Vicinamibacterales bacterium]